MNQALSRLDKVVGRAVEVRQDSSDLIGGGKVKAGYYMCSYRRSVGPSRLTNIEGWDNMGRKAVKLR